MDKEPVSAEPRSLHPIVFLAIYCVPIVFVWLLLRKGYSRSLRQAGFTYAFLLGLLPVMVAILDATFAPR